MNKTTVTTAVISAVAGGIVGGAVTYITVNKALMHRYEEWANSEIENVKERYHRMNEDGKRSLLEQAQNPGPEIAESIEAGKKILLEQGYSGLGTDENPEERHPTARTLSIFEQGVEVDEAGEEITNAGDAYLTAMDRGYEVVEGEPFLISMEEFFENEPDYELDTLTYYAEDDTLTDEKNSQIDRVDETVGARHLHMFPDTKVDEKKSIYVRNDEHETLYEVICIEGSYAGIVLSMDEETLGLKAPKERPKKMRASD